MGATAIYNFGTDVARTAGRRDVNARQTDGAVFAARPLMIVSRTCVLLRRRVGGARALGHLYVPKHP